MQSIRRTTTLMTILWVALILAVGQIVIDGVVNAWLVRQFDIALESKARALVTLTKFDGNEIELDFADEFMPEFEAPVEPEYFELFLGNGNLLERSNSFDGRPESKFSDQVGEVEVENLVLADGRDGRRVSIKFIPQIENKDIRDRISLDNRPRAILRVSRERESLNRELFRFHGLIIGISLVVLIAVMITVTRAINTGLKPLIRIRNEISQITPSSIDRRIATEEQPVELEPIATQFNLVLSEIEKAFIREREFSSDVAHELRTPVTEIRSLAEVGLRWPDEKDIRSYFSDIHESSRHLDRLIENLLHLCRSEDGNVELEISEVKLTDFLEKICRGFAEETRDKNISINLPKAKLPTLLVDAKLFELLLVNLIFNAVSHSPPDSSISIRFQADQEFGAIEIGNPMLDPLTSEDMNMIFKRFWRKDTARETGRHAGIGLSLVKSYAACMNLGVAASVNELGLFNIRLSNIKTL